MEQLRDETLRRLRGIAANIRAAASARVSACQALLEETKPDKGANDGLPPDMAAALEKAFGPPPAAERRADA